MSASDLTSESPSLVSPALPVFSTARLRGPRVEERILTGLTWIMAVSRQCPAVLRDLHVVGRRWLTAGLEAITHCRLRPSKWVAVSAMQLSAPWSWWASRPLISVPIGLFRRHLPGDSRSRQQTGANARFLAKVLTGFPSILAGVFVYAAMVVTMKSYSALAGGVAWRC